MPFLNLPLAVALPTTPSQAIDLSSISLTSAVVDIVQLAMCWPPDELFGSIIPPESRNFQNWWENLEKPIRNLYFSW